MARRETLTLDPFNPKDVEKFRTIADATDTPEMHEAFGIFLYSTENIDTLPEAVCHLGIAADAGLKEATGYLGDAYLKGKGVGKDVEKGMVLLRKSADMDSDESLYTLGLEYLYGRNVPCDYGLAFEYLKKASDMGSDRAMNGLGFMYLCGLHVEKDIEEARRLFKVSSSKGNRNAKNNLSMVKSLGPDHDYLSMLMSEEQTRDFNWGHTLRHHHR